MNSTDQTTPSSSACFEQVGDVLRAFGEWTSLTVGRGAAGICDKKIAVLDVRGVTRLDTAGALLLQDIIGAQQWADISVVADDPQHERLLHLAAKFTQDAATVQRKPSPFTLLLHRTGKKVVEELCLAVDMLSFFGGYLVSCWQVLRKPATLPFTSLVYHMAQVGVCAVPIVALLSFLIGLVIAYMGAQQLARFGAEIFVINLVEITTLRELGVLLTSIVIAGRSGSSFTAQIGAMKANEEVDAMCTMGLSPMVRLVFPRITALILMLPALVFLADIMGLLGGGLAVWAIIDMSPGAYAVRMQDAVQTSDFFVGLVKAPFFAAVIGVIGCFQGFQVTGSAESVGRLTTHAVVQAIFMVIVLDALFALFFTGIGV